MTFYISNIILSVTSASSVSRHPGNLSFFWAISKTNNFGVQQWVLGACWAQDQKGQSVGVAGMEYGFWSLKYHRGYTEMRGTHLV